MLNKSLFKKSSLTLEGQENNQAEAVPVYVCPGCRNEQEQDALSQNFYLCSRCGYHYKIGARERISMLVDEGSFTELDSQLSSRDPLQFPGYAAKLVQSAQNSGEKEAVLTGFASILGQACGFFAMEHRFMMGSMGSAVGEKLARLFEAALKRKLPVVGFTISGGARVQEGILSLMQMAKVSGAVRRHSDAGLLYVAVLCDATTGGVTASFAMLADIILAEPGALIGFAGPRVIEQTTRQTLPDGFQRAEFQLEKGFVSRLVKRQEQRAMLGKLLKLHPGGQP